MKDKKVLKMHLCGLLGFLVAAVIMYVNLPFHAYFKVIFALTPGGIIGYITVLVIVDKVYSLIQAKKSNRAIAL